MLLAKTRLYFAVYGERKNKTAKKKIRKEKKNTNTLES